MHSRIHAPLPWCPLPSICSIHPVPRGGCTYPHTVRTVSHIVYPPLPAYMPIFFSLERLYIEFSGGWMGKRKDRRPLPSPLCNLVLLSSPPLSSNLFPPFVLLCLLPPCAVACFVFSYFCDCFLSRFLGPRSGKCYAFPTLPLNLYFEVFPNISSRSVKTPDSVKLHLPLLSHTARNSAFYLSSPIRIGVR